MKQIEIKEYKYNLVFTKGDKYQVTDKLNSPIILLKKMKKRHLKKFKKKGYKRQGFKKYNVLQLDGVLLMAEDYCHKFGEQVQKKMEDRILYECWN